jgi:hypothetical protein
MVEVYAILNNEGRCINRVLWDGESNWTPPKDCTAIKDPDNLYPIVILSPEITTVEENIDVVNTTDVTQSGVTPDAS